MPELPEVETVRRGLAPHLEARRIESVRLNRPDLRFPFPPRFAERLTGRAILPLGRRAKYLLVPLDSGETLVIHLGMSGRVLIEAHERRNLLGEYHHETGRLPQHDHVEFALEGGKRVIFNDPRRFGFMLLEASETLEAHPTFAELGVEPLGNTFSAAHLLQRFAGRRTPLKAALLDQRHVAGLGNIYVCEALHRAGISPERAAATLAAVEAERLAAEIRAVLEEAIAAGGSTLRDYRHEDGSLGYFQHTFRVYDREGEPCPTPGCGGTIFRRVQGGRSTFFCEECQR
ncbi:MAG TPA: bifunctional DNA-formamidopyrimidine glycosylase/DNA-(apurinic or apyrimidinic site) lyase [Rhabdaerophilum sp.]|nr:bifunctional DNA-formamidopyrimidine glycosylase/DNA-(apurinic or apyrimidinic site) lyase [Rhabdaerophilum sp.]